MATPEEVAAVVHGGNPLSRAPRLLVRHSARSGESRGQRYYQLSVISYQLSVISYQLKKADYFDNCSLFTVH